MNKSIINKFSIIAVLVLFRVVELPAQEKKVENLLEKAKMYYEIGYDERALDLYNRVLDIDGENLTANFYTGVIILNSNKKWEALPYLLKTYQADSTFGRNLDYYLAQAFQYDNKFERALFHYSAANTKISHRDKEVKEDIEIRIEQCQVAVELKDSGETARVENLGSKVNTSADDYSPVLFPGEDKIIFTSNRKGTRKTLMDLLAGQSYDDVFVTETRGKNWREPQNVGKSVNTKYHDSGLFVDQTGNAMLIYRGENNGDIFMAEFADGKWTDPVNLGKNINTPKYMESSASLSPDGKTLFFTSERAGGFGGTDIYMSERDENGQWCKAKNLGSVINTEKEEEAPFISADGNVLFFSSTGHRGIGGFDIFYATKDKNTGKWSQPQNLGIPVNTPQDDIYFVLGQDGKHGYYSAIHKDSYGERDIYRVSLVDKLYENTIFLANSEVKPMQTENQHYYEVTEEASFSTGGQEWETSEKEVFRNIYFEFDENKLTGEAYQKLDRVVEYLESYDYIVVELAGHTDGVGTEEYNTTLSKKRAEVVFRYLVGMGISPSRLIIKGYGGSRPLASNDDEHDGRTLNRRVEFNIVREGSLASIEY